jgi:hypothetical protein
MRTRNRSQMVAMQGSPYAPTPRGYKMQDTVDIASSFDNISLVAPHRVIVTNRWTWREFYFVAKQRGTEVSCARIVDAK